MINYYAWNEIEIIRKAGRIANNILSQLIIFATVGRELIEIDSLAEKLIKEAGGYPSFKMEKGYFWSTCLCLNDTVVHGIPNKEKLKNGDVLGIDLGVFMDGYHADTAWTICVGGESSATVKEFLSVGEASLSKAIDICRIGNYIGNISQVIQSNIEGRGYSCVKQLVGHGVGKQLHEDPEVPCYLRGKVENTPELKEGMVLAIEIIYNQGKSPIVYKNDDGWTIVTRDGSLSAVFEHTVAITKQGPIVLTNIAI